MKTTKTKQNTVDNDNNLNSFNIWVLEYILNI